MSLDSMPSDPLALNCCRTSITAGAVDSAMSRWFPHSEPPALCLDNMRKRNPGLGGGECLEIGVSQRSRYLESKARTVKGFRGRERLNKDTQAVAL
jgi:hypothetical protein